MREVEKGERRGKRKRNKETGGSREEAGRVDLERSILNLFEAS